MRVVQSVLASAVCVSWLSITGTASAQEASPTGKGVVGGALLGAELVMAIEAAFDVQSTWAYIGGGLAGAAAGGVGGYFVERDSTARVPMLMLAGGLTLAIPTTVAVLNATAYEPPADYVKDRPPTDEPVADPPKPASPPKTGRTPGRVKVAHKVPALPPALVDIDRTRLALSVPAVELRDVYTRKEVSTFGVEQATELRIPVLNVLF